MNRERRSEISKAIALLDEAKELLTDVQLREQESFDNLPEGLQQSESGQKSEEAIDALDSAVTDIVQVIALAEEASA